jgi:tetratricopeptide (TPR) repeat protein
MNYLGYLYVEDNRNLRQAEAMIKKALEIEPANGAYLDSLGWLYFKQGKPRQAIKELEKASALMKDPLICEHLGDAYLGIGDARKARLNWMRSLELSPEQENVRRKIKELDR